MKSAIKIGQKIKKSGMKAAHGRQAVRNSQAVMGAAREARRIAAARAVGKPAAGGAGASAASRGRDTLRKVKRRRTLPARNMRRGLFCIIWIMWQAFFLPHNEVKLCKIGKACRVGQYEGGQGVSHAGYKFETIRHQ